KQDAIEHRWRDEGACHSLAGQRLFSTARGRHFYLERVGVALAEPVGLARLQSKLHVGRLIRLERDALALAPEPDKLLEVAAGYLEFSRGVARIANRYDCAARQTQFRRLHLGLEGDEAADGQRGADAYLGLRVALRHHFDAQPLAAGWRATTARRLDG